MAYNIDEAYRRVESRGIEVRGARVIVDTLTNEVRGMRTRQALSPEELVHPVHQLRRLLMSMGAAGAVVCQLKQMEITDVTPYNRLLHEYLQMEQRYGCGGYGCRTQIRLDQLKPDGYHVRPSFSGVIYRSYACAMLGIEVPCPTPDDGFVPTIVRRRWEAEWPSVSSKGRAQYERHGRS